MRNIEQEGFDIAAGLTAVEAGPDLVKSGMKDVFDSSNLGKDISHTELGKNAENAIDWTQEIAPSVAVLGFTYLGLKTMFKGLEDPGKRRAY